MKKIQIETREGYILVHGYSDFSGAVVELWGEERKLIFSIDEVAAIILVLAHVTKVGNTDTSEGVELLKKEGKIKEV